MRCQLDPELIRCRACGWRFGLAQAKITSKGPSCPACHAQIPESKMSHATDRPAMKAGPSATRPQSVSLISSSTTAARMGGVHAMPPTPFPIHKFDGGIL
jgi:hypothetical protein